MVSPNISKKKFKLMQRRIGGARALNLFFDNCFLYFIRMFSVAQIHKFSSPNDCFHPSNHLRIGFPLASGVVFQKKE